MPLTIDELIIYLESRLNKINDTIRDQMTKASSNNELTRQAGQLQTTLTKIGKEASPKDLDAAAVEIDQMLKSAAGSSDVSDVQRQQLMDLSQSLKARAAELRDPGPHGAVEGISSMVREANMVSAVTAAKEMMSTVVTQTSHTDQANLARIQSLVSQMGQATNLVSNMIAAFNEGMKSIISNTRS